MGFYELKEEFSKALGEALQKFDVQILHNAYEASTDHDRKSPLDHAFREMLLFRIRDNVEQVDTLVRLSVEAARLNIASATIPVVLFGDIFDIVTIEKCDRIFFSVEGMVDVWKEETFFSACKNKILRMCNDLLRRLSRTQNTAFRGRILLFLSMLLPVSERSGLNVVSEFNLENVTDYGVYGKDADYSLEVAVGDKALKIDYNLYCKFWSLQDFFRNPNQCYSKMQWKMFHTHTSAVLEAFSNFQLDETRPHSAAADKAQAATLAKNVSDKTLDMDTNETPHADTQPASKPGELYPSSETLKNTAASALSTDDLLANKMEVDNGDACGSDAMDYTGEIREILQQSDQFFAKFLTSPKLLALQFADSTFRRSLLLQFLIIFQYLQHTVKFKAPLSLLTIEQKYFVDDSISLVYGLLEKTPPNGKQFLRSVKHIMKREEIWNKWKNDGCKEFRKPDDIEKAATEAQISDSTEEGEPGDKRDKPTFGELLRNAHRQGKFYLANDVLTDLWNYSPDNMQACRSKERNFLPKLETFLLTTHEKNDPTFEWRALRLMARQSPHFTSFLNPGSNKTSDFIEFVKRRHAKDLLENTKEETFTNPSDSVETTETNSGQPIKAISLQVEQQEAETETVDEQENLLSVDDEQGDFEKENDDCETCSKPITATREQIERISPFIGEDWKVLGKKLGYKSEELLYYEIEHPDAVGGCTAMLSNWFANDEDANLDNLAYILEGLNIIKAAKLVQEFAEKLDENDVEIVE